MFTRINVSINADNVTDSVADIVDNPIEDVDTINVFFETMISKVGIYCYYCVYELGGGNIKRA